MNNVLRNDLLLLSQFGFSDKLLTILYENRIHYLDSIFDHNSSFYKTNISFFTKKDIELSSDYQKLLDFYKPFLDKMREYKNKGIRILYRYDKTFPDGVLPKNSLRMFLFVYGNLPLIYSEKKVAIVGSRNISNQTKILTSETVDAYIKDGYVTISGLAKGVDTIVHQETINKNGNTIAVLATPFEKIYPKENEKLFYDIIQSGGLILTLHGPFSHTHKSHFLDRNEIVAELCNEIVMTEASIKSGTLNTIRNASLLNKSIFYIPSLIESEVEKYIIELGAQNISYRKQGGK